MARIKRTTTAEKQQELLRVSRCRVIAKQRFPGWPVPDEIVVEAVTKKWSFEEFRAFWGHVLMEHYNGSTTKTRESMRMAGWNPPSVAQLTELLGEEPCRSWLETKPLSRERRAGLATDFDIKLFWSKVLMNPREAKSFRFRASENLAKSYSMFVDRVKHEGDMQVTLVDAIKKLDERGAAE